MTPEIQNVLNDVAGRRGVDLQGIAALPPIQGTSMNMDVAMPVVSPMDLFGTISEGVSALAPLEVLELINLITQTQFESSDSTVVLPPVDMLQQPLI